MTKNKTFFRKSIFAAAMIFTSICAWGQYPVNGGFEAGTLPAATNWSFASSATVSMANVSNNARTGTNCIAVTQIGLDGTSARALTYAGAAIPALATQSLHLIYWAKNSVTGAGSVGGGTVPTGQSTSLSNGSSSTVGPGTTYTRFVSNKTSIASDYASAKPTIRTYVYGPVGSLPNTLYIDDYIVYIDYNTKPDLLKPNAPSALSVAFGSGSSAALTWTNGSDVDETPVPNTNSSNTGVQATLVLRTSNLSAAAPVLNDQAVYSTGGGTAGPNMIGDWKVISISATSGYSNTPPTAGIYKYAIVHRDMAYNYSTATVSEDHFVSGATTLASALTISSGKALNVANGSTLELAAGAQLTNDGTLTVEGTLQLNDGAALAGSGTVSYTGGGTLAFNKTTNTTINGGESFWPYSNGPSNVSVLQNTLTLDVNRLISGTASVSSGATLITNANKQLTVGTLANAGTVTLKSNASGTATIKPTTITGSGTFNVEQYLLTGRNWYLSSPVAAALAPASGIANYYEYIEAGNNNPSGQAPGSSAYWKGIANGDPLTVGKGYIAKATGLTTIQFSGALNNNASYPITLSKVGNGFNLVGNPYPAFLDWKAVYTANSGANMPSGTVWYRSTNYNSKRAWANGETFSANEVIYNGTSFYSTVLGGTAGGIAPTGTTINTNYSDGGITDWQYQGSVYVFATVNALTETPITTLNATNLIPPMQAFWVQTSTNASPLTISKTQCKHNDTGSAIVIKAPKSQQSNSQLARLQLSNNITADEAIVYFNANASNSFDRYDSPKMFNNTASMPEIYTQVGDQKLVINGFNSVNDVTEVPLGFVTQRAGSFTLKLNEFTNFDSSSRVLLTDATKPGATFDLTDGSAYSFTADITPATTNRFSLLFRAPGVTTDIDNAVKTNTQVFVNAANQIAIIAPEKSNYAIYNVVGMKLENGVTTSNSQTFKLQTGIYVVKVNNQTTRVIVK